MLEESLRAGHFEQKLTYPEEIYLEKLQRSGTWETANNQGNDEMYQI